MLRTSTEFILCAMLCTTSRTITPHAVYLHRIHTVCHIAYPIVYLIMCHNVWAWCVSYCMTCVLHIVLRDHNMSMKHKHLKWSTTIDEPFRMHRLWFHTYSCMISTVTLCSSRRWLGPIVSNPWTYEWSIMHNLIHAYENCNMKYFRLNIIILQNQFL
jgi:hypothetical protein